MVTPDTDRGEPEFPAIEDLFGVDIASGDYSWDSMSTILVDLAGNALAGSVELLEAYEKLRARARRTGKEYRVRGGTQSGIEGVDTVIWIEQ